MTSDLMLLIQQELEREYLRFGSITIRITYHDGRPSYYEITTQRRRNLSPHPKNRKEVDNARETC
jgi:hypothetical protein